MACHGWWRRARARARAALTLALAALTLTLTLTPTLTLTLTLAPTLTLTRCASGAVIGGDNTVDWRDELGGAEGLAALSSTAFASSAPSAS